MTNPSATAHAITNSTRTSLELVNSSIGILSPDQLRRVRTQLQATLAIVNDRIKVKFSARPATRPVAVIDCTSSSDSSSDEGDASKKKGERTVTDTDGVVGGNGSCGESGKKNSANVASGADGNGNVTELPETSGPYPMNAPDVAVDKSGFWCVVDGTDVGTSADSGRADFTAAVSKDEKLVQ